MTLWNSIRSLRGALLGIVLAAMTPLAQAQHSGGGGGAPGGQHGGASPAMVGPQESGGAHGSAPGQGQSGQALAGMPPSIRSAPAMAIPGRFWNDRGLARTLKLRPEQTRRMDEIFDANRPTLQTLFTNLQREEAVLSGISPKNTQDQTKVFAAIDRVAQARADLEKEKTQLVQALRGTLDPGQAQQLDQMAASR